ncbi:hypothetical protein AHiyo4_00330 [Arthrobacter sp. Hiyo4]|nr:hypothetical protein AHiyo4_00330 [Arthrobacter sp. Hiyo4]
MDSVAPKPWKTLRFAQFQSVGAVLILPSAENTVFDAIAPILFQELVCSVRTLAAIGLSLRLRR